MNSIRSEIIAFFKDNFINFNENEIGDTDSLLENGILDSTSILELINFLEEKYDIAIDDDEITPENFDTLVNLEKFLSQKVGNEVSNA